jgi:hypothetical protein
MQISSKILLSDFRCLQHNRKTIKVKVNGSAKRPISQSGFTRSAAGALAANRVRPILIRRGVFLFLSVTANGFALCSDAVSLELLVKQGAVDAEHPGGAGLVELGGFERPPQGFLLG